MAKAKHLTGAEALLRRFALTFPEAYEDHPWDHVAIKVKGKIFLIMSGGKSEDELNLSMKLPVSGSTALTLPFASPMAYGLGKSGWVSARFGADDQVPVEMIQEWIDESFRAIAPKRILARLEDAESNNLPATPKRKKQRGQTKTRPD
jgi:predicted DNA-binding protein (MmcQ/YjbR family)